MVDRNDGRPAEGRDGAGRHEVHEGLGENLKAISDKIGCAANAPLENFEPHHDDSDR